MPEFVAGISDVDWKYQINAVNPCSENRHTQKDAVLFLAKDKGFLEAALPAYLEWCKKNGTNPAHIEAVELLMGRVKQYQEQLECKIPDTDLPCEVRRCVDGEGVAK